MKSLIVLASLLATSIAMACPSNRLCSSDRVIDSGENVGTVKEVFSNGQATVYLDGFGTYTSSTSSLGKGFRCIENVCVNDRAIDRENNTGTIKELFDNGKSKVYLDGLGTYIRSFSSLGIELNCSLRENCSCRN
jgi:hypothetical protein